MAVADATVEPGEDDVGAVDLVAGGGEVFAVGAEFGPPVVGVFQEPGSLWLVRVGAGAGVPAQFGLEERVDCSGIDEVDQAVGEVAFLGPGGQPDGQSAGDGVVDDGAAAVGVGDAVVDEPLVQGQVGQRAGLGQPVAGSGRRPYAVIGFIHRSRSCFRVGNWALALRVLRSSPVLCVLQSAASRSGCPLSGSWWRSMLPGGWEIRSIASGAVRPSSRAQLWMWGQTGWPS